MEKKEEERRRDEEGRERSEKGIILTHRGLRYTECHIKQYLAYIMLCIVT